MAEKKKYHRVTFTYEGKRYERYGKTAAEAHEKAAALKVALKNGTTGVSSNMTVKAWAMEWLETYKAPSIGPKQYEDYLRYIDKDIVPAIGSRAIKDIKDVDLQKIINRRAGQSKSSVDKVRKAIKSIFRRAYLSRLIDRDPSETLEAPAAEAGTHRSITAEERALILKLAQSHYAGLWVLLMLYCGLRPGETRALQWRHVDLDNKIIHVEQAMKANSRTIGAPKSAAGIRDVPIPDVLMDKLRAAQSGPFMPVLARETEGLHHTKSSMRNMWSSFMRALDILMGARLYRSQIVVSVVAPDLVPYCLRHTYCTDLQDKGVPINVARYLMGHADISVTAKIYTHTTEKAIQDAAEKINNVGQTVGQVP